MLAPFPAQRSSFPIDSRTVAEALDIPRFDQHIQELGTRWAAEAERKREKAQAKVEILKMAIQMARPLGSAGSRKF